MGQKRLGDVVLEINFTDAAKTRISASFRNKLGLPYKILTEKYSAINRKDFWEWSHNVFGISGFRAGRAKEVVLKKALEALDDTKSKRNFGLWRLYRNCVVEFMGSDNKALNELLLNESIDETKISTKEIFDEILRKSPLYDVTPQTIRDFYDIWGFDTFEGIDEVLKQSPGLDKEVVTGIVRAEIRKAEESLRTTLAEIETQVKELSGEMREQFRKAESAAKEQDERFANSTAVLRTEVANVSATVVNKKVNELGANLKKQLSSPKEPKGTQVPPDEFLKLAEKVSTLSKRVANLDSQAPSSGALKSSKQFKSNLPGSEILTAWQSSLQKTLPSKVSQNFMALSVAVLRSTNVIVLDPSEDIRSLAQIATQPENIFSVTIVPTWTTPREIELAFLSIDWKSPYPIFIYIRDFDLGVQDLYLFPVLNNWLTSKLRPLDKVFLVQSNSEDGDISRRIFDFALPLPYNPEAFEDLERYFKNSDLDKRLKEMVAGDASEILKVHSEIDFTLFEDLQRLAKNSGFSIGTQVAKLFAQLVVQLSKLVERGPAFEAALKIAVLPAIQRRHGDAAKRVVEERILSVLGG